MNEAAAAHVKTNLPTDRYVLKYNTNIILLLTQKFVERKRARHAAIHKRVYYFWRLSEYYTTFLV